MYRRNDLLKKIAQYDFAVVELSMYLDSHPQDFQTIMKRDEFVKKSTELREQFNREFGPIDLMQINKNDWVWKCDPWPWDNEEVY